MGQGETKSLGKTLIKKCHMCGHISETVVELQKCPTCQKAFLPLNYFNKVHNSQSAEFHHLYSNSDEITEEDIIKGIYVLW